LPEVFGGSKLHGFELGKVASSCGIPLGEEWSLGGINWSCLINFHFSVINYNLPQMESKQHKQALSNLQNKIGDKDVNNLFLTLSDLG